MQENEIVLYQPDDAVRIEVRMANESVWLTQSQIALLFGVKQPAISKHLINIFKSGELEEDSVYSILEYTESDGKLYKTKFYNLDAILSVGYCVNSINATLFRKWANTVLKEYLLKGYSVNQHLMLMEQRIDRQLQEHSEQIHGLEKKVDFFVCTALPPAEGIFYDGQIFDAYTFVNDLIRSAKSRIILFDNYVDDTVLTMLDKRDDGVSAQIYTRTISPQLALDLQRHNAQYQTIAIDEFQNAHDRFLCIDDTVYHLGASLKDLGKKWFAFSRMEIGGEGLWGKM